MMDTNVPFYVGIGNKKRPNQLKRRSEFWQNIVDKHGLIVEIVYENLQWKECCEIEKSLIKKYGRRINNSGILVNQTVGGDGRVGCKPWNKGIPRTEEEKSNISKSKLGIPMSDKGREGMKENGGWNKGLTKDKDPRLVVSEETRRIMSESHIGKSHKGGYKLPKNFTCICEKCNSLYNSFTTEGTICYDCKEKIEIICECGCGEKFFREKYKVMEIGKYYKYHRNKKGVCWILNVESKETKMIPKEELQNWIDCGWNVGRKLINRQ